MLIKHSLKFLLVIKTKNELPTLCATTVKKCSATGRKEIERAYLLVYLWCGVSRRSISLTAIFVWRTQKVLERKIGKISYPSIPSAIRPVLHSDEFPPPVFNGFLSSEDEETGSEEECMDMEYKKKKKTDTESEDSSTESKKAVPQQFNQSELNDLVRDLDLSKQAAEILASRLNEKHVLHSSAKVSFYRKRDELFLPYFKEEKQLVYL